ncbi:uncharacterized protein LOC143821996 [Paroedura picta]|uniref:uncharacterized protein LOC143821996 n=1 Tax=Paroedura picta TaxID=143630 RepID=UPI004056F7C6
MQGTLMVGVILACLLPGGDHQYKHIQAFEGVWYHTGELVNGTGRNELDSVKIRGNNGQGGGTMLEIRRIRNGKCDQDVIFLAPTNYIDEYETIWLSRVRFLEVKFDQYCILHVALRHYESTFLHLFTRAQQPSDADKLNFEFYVGIIMRMDFKQIVYPSETDLCPW